MYALALHMVHIRLEAQLKNLKASCDSYCGLRQQMSDHLRQSFQKVKLCQHCFIEAVFKEIVSRDEYFFEGL